MKLYTSYFYQVRFFPKNLVGLSTAYWNPKYRPMGQDARGIICLDVPPLKPGAACEGLCNGNCALKHPQSCKFLETYYNQLEQIDFKNFIEHLESLANTIKIGENLIEDVDFAFLVYESPKNICSERWSIQKWFKNHGVEIKEWKR